MSAAEALLLFISVEFSKGWEDILISPVSGEVEDYLRAAGIVVAWESGVFVGPGPMSHYFEDNLSLAKAMVCSMTDELARVCTSLQWSLLWERIRKYPALPDLMARHYARAVPETLYRDGLSLAGHVLERSSRIDSDVAEGARQGQSADFSVLGANPAKRQKCDTMSSAEDLLLFVAVSCSGGWEDILVLSSMEDELGAVAIVVMHEHGCQLTQFNERHLTPAKTLVISMVSALTGVCKPQEWSLLWDRIVECPALLQRIARIYAHALPSVLHRDEEYLAARIRDNLRITRERVGESALTRNRFSENENLLLFLAAQAGGGFDDILQVPNPEYDLEGDITAVGIALQIECGCKLDSHTALERVDVQHTVQAIIDDVRSAWTVELWQGLCNNVESKNKVGEARRKAVELRRRICQHFCRTLPIGLWRDESVLVRHIVFLGSAVPSFVSGVRRTERRSGPGEVRVRVPMSRSVHGRSRNNDSASISKTDRSLRQREPWTRLLSIVATKVLVQNFAQSLPELFCRCCDQLINVCDPRVSCLECDRFGFMCVGCDALQHSHSARKNCRVDSSLKGALREQPGTVVCMCEITNRSFHARQLQHNGIVTVLGAPLSGAIVHPCIRTCSACRVLLTSKTCQAVTSREPSRAETQLIFEYGSVSLSLQEFKCLTCSESLVTEQCDFVNLRYFPSAPLQPRMYFCMDMLSKFKALQEIRVSIGHKSLIDMRQKVITERGFTCAANVSEEVLSNALLYYRTMAEIVSHAADPNVSDPPDVLVSPTRLPWCPKCTFPEVDPSGKLVHFIYPRALIGFDGSKKIGLEYSRNCTAGESLLKVEGILDPISTPYMQEALSKATAAGVAGLQPVAVEEEMKRCDGHTADVGHTHKHLSQGGGCLACCADGVPLHYSEFKKGECGVFFHAAMLYLKHFFKSDADMWAAYDLACKETKYLDARDANLMIFLKIFLPNFHSHAHEDLCQLLYALRYVIGAGRPNSEVLEQEWAFYNGISGILQTMLTHKRRDMINVLFMVRGREKVSRVLSGINHLLDVCCRELPALYLALAEHHLDFEAVQKQALDPSTAVVQGVPRLSPGALFVKQIQELDKDVKLISSLEAGGRVLMGRLKAENMASRQTIVDAKAKKYQSLWIYKTPPEIVSAEQILYVEELTRWRVLQCIKLCRSIHSQLEDRRMSCFQTRASQKDHASYRKSLKSARDSLTRQVEVLKADVKNGATWCESVAVQWNLLRLKATDVLVTSLLRGDLEPIRIPLPGLNFGRDEKIHKLREGYHRFRATWEQVPWSVRDYRRCVLSVDVNRKFLQDAITRMEGEASLHMCAEQPVTPGSMCCSIRSLHHARLSVIRIRLGGMDRERELYMNSAQRSLSGIFFAQSKYHAQNRKLHKCDKTDTHRFACCTTMSHLVATERLCIQLYDGMRDGLPVEPTIFETDCNTLKDRLLDILTRAQPLVSGIVRFEVPNITDVTAVDDDDSTNELLDGTIADRIDTGDEEPNEEVEYYDGQIVPVEQFEQDDD